MLSDTAEQRCACLCAPCRRALVAAGVAVMNGAVQLQTFSANASGSFLLLSDETRMHEMQLGFLLLKLSPGHAGSHWARGLPGSKPENHRIDCEDKTLATRLRTIQTPARRCHRTQDFCVLVGSSEIFLDWLR